MEEYIKNFEKKLVVYTAIVENYDTLRDLVFIDDNCDYVCFTDNKELASDI